MAPSTNRISTLQDGSWQFQLLREIAHKLCAAESGAHTVKERHVFPITCCLERYGVQHASHRLKLGIPGTQFDCRAYRFCLHNGTSLLVQLQHLPHMSLDTVSKHLLLAALQQVTTQQFVPEGSETFVHLLS